MRRSFSFRPRIVLQRADSHAAAAVLINVNDFNSVRLFFCNLQPI